MWVIELENFTVIYGSSVQLMCRISSLASNIYTNSAVQSNKVNETEFNTFVFLCGSIDATDEPRDGPFLGRLANHCQVGNARVQIVEVSKKPHVCLFATRNITAGEQILYNYGIHVPFADMVIFIYLFYYVN